ncbi:MAG: hypothetical protein ACJ71W_12040 [Terriglobales bacterium]
MTTEAETKFISETGVHKLEPQKVDYDEYAREAAQEAFEDAIAAGFPEPVAKRFQEVFGAPVPQEFRLS